jgi:hypothetical protein
MSRRPHSVVKFAIDAATSQIVEPPTSIREDGFATGTRPPAQWLNYLFRDLSLWIDRLRGPSRREWTRYEIAATELGMPAVDPITNPETLTAPARRMIAIKGTGDRVMASVRGTALTELTMVSGPDTAVLAACATNNGWLVGGAHTSITQGRIVGTTFDPDAGSAVKTPATAWTVHTVPALMRGVYSIVARTSGTLAGDAVAVIDDDEILVRTGPTTWAYATTSIPLGANGSDVCDTGEQWIFVDTSGIVFRSSWPSAVTFAAVSTFSGGGAWRLASDDRGTVVAYRAGEPSPEDWYISTDHGLTWLDVSAPPYTNITRIRYVDGTWLLGSEDWPHVAESNDLVSWQACPVPHADSASMRINDFALLDGAIVAVGSNHWLRGARGELVAPGPWSPAGLSLATADAGYLQGRVIAATAPTAGQVLAWNDATSVWEPTAPGGGSLPAGTNGGVLRYAGGAWASTAAGTSGQLLQSNGAAAPTWVTITTVAYTWTAEQTFSGVAAFTGRTRVTATDVAGTAYTLAVTDAGYLRLTNAAARTVTLPAAGAVVAGDAGLEWRIHDAARSADTAAVTITAPAGVTLNGTSEGSVVLDTKGGAVIVRVTGANAWETVGL